MNHERKILIVGNGFDLQHGLKTGYRDFIEYCRVLKTTKITTREKVSNYHEMQKLIRELYSMCPSVYEELDDLLDSFWINYFVKLPTKRLDWIDFERDIESTVKTIYKSIESDGKYLQSKQFDEYRQYLPEMDRNISISEEIFQILNRDLKKLNRLLEIYLETRVYPNIQKIPSKYQLFKDIHPDMVISFNYTNTYAEIYNPTIKFDYIHGKADIKRNASDCNMVLGFDDHYFNNENTVLEIVPFEKYYQRIVNRTSNDYQQWITQMCDAARPYQKHLYFYGHSFSPADGDVIKKLITNPYTDTTIYYRKGVETDRARIIQNLAVILTPDELLNRINKSVNGIIFKEVDMDSMRIDNNM